MEYDVIIIGAGPGGIFCAYELMEQRAAFARKYQRDLKVLMIEKGRSIEQRRCPKRTAGQCLNCQPCAITTGFAGAGAFSDGKLSLSPDVGGNLPAILGYDKTGELIRESDRIYLRFGADASVYGMDKEKEIREIRKKAITANLKLVECPIRHLGTEEGYKIYAKLQQHLLDAGVEIVFNTKVERILVTAGPVPAAGLAGAGQEQAAGLAGAGQEQAAGLGGAGQEQAAGLAAAGRAQAAGVVTDRGDTYYGREVVCAVGREGADWFKDKCAEIGIATIPGTVDIGVRVEVRNEIMQFLNENLYEAKLIYHTPTFDDKVRTFCTNPSGEVSSEYYEGGLAVVNGHAYKSAEHKTANTNLAILVSKNFTKPFTTPIEYGKHIAQLSNMLCGGRILVQTFGDFRRGRRTNEERLCRNNLIPTLKDAVPGDLSLVFPHRIMVDIEEMLWALDKITPGIAGDETLLYGVEVKFYSNKVVVDQDFATSIAGIYAIGDGAGVTRGLQQASANGLSAGRSILRKWGIIQVG